jgi:hypothetical protein
MFEQDLLFAIGQPVHGGFDFDERVHAWELVKKYPRFGLFSLISAFIPAETSRFLTRGLALGICDAQADLIAKNCTYGCNRLKLSIFLIDF